MRGNITVTATPGSSATMRRINTRLAYAPADSPSRLRLTHTKSRLVTDMYAAYASSAYAESFHPSLRTFCRGVSLFFLHKAPPRKRNAHSTLASQPNGKARTAPVSPGTV